MTIKLYSLNRRLLLQLWFFLTLVILSIGVFIFSSAYHEIEELFDAGLARSAKILLQLTEHELAEHDGEGDSIELGLLDGSVFHKYEKNIHAQIWKGDSRVYHSDNLFMWDKPRSVGFQDKVLNHHKWRTLVFFDPKSDVTIEVAERYSVRDELIFKIVIGLFIPLFLVIPVILILIHVIISQALKPLNQLSAEVALRSANSLTPLNLSKVPVEIYPLVLNLNQLLDRLNDSLEHERQFTNHAAHELRTPLAVLKVQMNLLEHSASEAERRHALDDLKQGIARMVNMVDQLLTMARVSSEAFASDAVKPVFLVDLLKDVVAELKLGEEESRVQIQLSEQLFVRGEKHLLAIMFRNLLLNALMYGCPGTPILVREGSCQGHTGILVCNQVAEVSDSMNNDLFQRFYRISGSPGMGCGLGLSVVQRIADLHGQEVSVCADRSLNQFCIVISPKA